MLSYDMGARGGLGLYEYLYRCIRDDVLSGMLDAHDKLPSKRALARQLGVSVVTVESAYAQLVAEGYVYSRPKSGYYVAAIPRPEAGAGRVHSTVTQAPATAPGAQQLLADFTRPAPYASASAAELWGKSLRGALAHEPRGELFAVQPLQGNERLRTAIAGYLRSARGMAVDAQHIVVAAGAQALYGVVALLVGPGAAVALEDPGYPRLAQVYAAHGLQPRPCALDAEGMHMPALERAGARLVHIMPSHQFPTGRVTSIARRYELLGWAARAGGRYLVEDDYDWEFRFAGRPIPALASIDTQGRVIYLGTFSKSLASALRIAFAVLPPALSERYERELGFLANTVSSIDQIALARLIEGGGYERHVSRYRKQARDVRDALVAALSASALGPLLQVEEADSGLHFVLALDVAATEQEVAERALQGGVRLAPLSGYAALPECAQAPDGLRRFVMQYDGLDVTAVGQVARVLEEACR